MVIFANEILHIRFRRGPSVVAELSLSWPAGWFPPQSVSLTCDVVAHYGCVSDIIS